MKCFPTSVPSKVRNCAELDNLRSDISFSRSFDQFNMVHMSHSPLALGTLHSVSAWLRFVRNKTFAQSRIFLEGHCSQQVCREIVEPVADDSRRGFYYISVISFGVLREENSCKVCCGQNRL